MSRLPLCTYPINSGSPKAATWYFTVAVKSLLCNAVGLGYCLSNRTKTRRCVYACQSINQSINQAIYLSIYLSIYLLSLGLHLLFEEGSSPHLPGAPDAPQNCRGEEGGSCAHLNAHLLEWILMSRLSLCNWSQVACSYSSRGAKHVGEREGERERASRRERKRERRITVIIIIIIIIKTESELNPKQDPDPNP